MRGRFKKQPSGCNRHWEVAVHRGGAHQSPDPSVWVHKLGVQSLQILQSFSWGTVNVVCSATHGSAHNLGRRLA